MGEWQAKHFDDEDPWQTWDGSFCMSFCTHLKPSVAKTEWERKGKPLTPFEAPLLSVIKERLDEDCMAELLAIAVSKPGTITPKHPDTVKVLKDMSDESKEMLASLVARPGTAELHHPDCIATVQAFDSEDPERIYADIARPLADDSEERCEVATCCMVQSLAGISRLAAAKDDWAHAQKLDPMLAPIFEALEKKKRGESFTKAEAKQALKEVSEEGERAQAIKTLIAEAPNLLLTGPDPVKLFRRTLIQPNPELVYQFVVPEDARFTAFKSCHKDAGHQGITRTQALLQDHLWCPQIGEYVKEHVSKCGRCRQYCGPPPARSPLVPQTVGAPLEQIHIDFLQVQQGWGQKLMN